jgi:hypothetical protein
VKEVLPERLVPKGHQEPLDFREMPELQEPLVKQDPGEAQGSLDHREALALLVLLVLKGLKV